MNAQFNRRNRINSFFGLRRKKTFNILDIKRLGGFFAPARCMVRKCECQPEGFACCGRLLVSEYLTERCMDNSGLLSIYTLIPAAKIGV